MNFQTIMLIGTYLITVVIALIVIPILKKIKVGQIERDDGPKSHLKKQGTPTMGGIIFMISITISTIASYIFFKNQQNYAVADSIIPILLLTLGFGAVGMVDDFKKLV